MERTDTFLGYKKKKKEKKLDRGVMEKYTTQLALREIQSYVGPRLPPMAWIYSNSGLTIINPQVTISKSFNYSDVSLAG